ncbi:MAG: DUF3800 domain-containing protein [Firmicutes bacterium]|nr:DUF3800 domain-containing protein [Bacillota bacterium]
MEEGKKINWRDKPTRADRWSDDATYILYVDENGDSNLKNIVKNIDYGKKIDENDRYFNICTTLISRENHNNIASSLVEIKHKYWNNGMYEYKDGLKTVCLHSDEIRKQLGPFSKNTIDQNSFLNDLNHAMKEMDITIFDCFVDKALFYQKYYSNAKEPYSIGMEYILERIVNRIGDNDKVMIVCEGIGKREDYIVLNTIKLLMSRGTYYVDPKKFKKITGVYFNSKRTFDSSKSYIGLEVADLCAYPIYKYCRYNHKDQAFYIIEEKIHGYPLYEGRGLKFVP